jgi:Protein of unknown function (DUF1524)
VARSADTGDTHVVRTPLRLIALLAATLALATACTETPLTSPSGPGDLLPTNAVGAAEARTSLAALTVAAWQPMTGYSRDRFPHWRKAGANCDVRDAVLKRDGKNVQLDGCNVTGGSWYSWYDAKTYTELTKVDIDHMVPLANAWRSGADKWTDAKRSDFANDMERPQLFAVAASANRSKGDQDPSTWKPTNPGAWCDYARDWITVKAYWKLTVTAKEKDALAEMLNSCA